MSMPPWLMTGPSLIVMLLRSVKSRAITRFRLPSLLSTRKLAPDASASSASSPLTVSVSFSFLLMVSPVLPANFRPSSIVATSISSIAIRVMPSLPSTPGTPFLTLIVPLAPSLPFRPIVPSLPLMLTPSLPFSPLTMIVPGSLSSPTVRSLPKPKSISLSRTVVTMLPSVLVYLTVSPS